MELGHGTEEKAKSGETLRSTLGQCAKVRYIEPRATVELWDLDALTTEEEVTTTVNTALNRDVEAIVFVFKPNLQGQRMVTCYG